MGRKIEFSEIELEFINRGYKLFETEFISAQTKMKFTCPMHENKGIIFITWNNFKKGQGCKYCGDERMGASKRLSFEFVLSEFDKRGYDLLDKTYKNNLTKMEYTCRLHPNIVQKINYSSLIDSGVCRLCSIHRVLDIDIIKKEFSERGYILLEDEYVHYDNKMKYKCLIHNDVIQEIKYGNFYNKKGCKYCGFESSSKKQRLKYDHVVNVMAKNGYILLDEVYINSTIRMKYRCIDHPEEIQEATYASFYVSGACRFCKLDKISGENNYQWLGGITKLNAYLRSRLFEWTKESLDKFGFRCAITGIKGELHVHHLIGFHTILKEILTKLGLSVHKDIGDYSTIELNRLKEEFIIEHNKLLGIPLLPEVHYLFHNIYGKMNNTEEQFREFEIRLLSGEFENFKVTAS